MPPPEDPAPSEPPPHAGQPTGRAGFRHLGDEVRFEGWAISLVEAAFEAPDGSSFRRDVVRHPGAVCVVPLTDDGGVVLLRQYRGALDRFVLEIPAGTRDVAGEAPELTARRELEEEAGVRAGRLTLLGRMYNSPGFCDQETLVYLAEGLTPGRPERHGVEERFLEVVQVPLDEVGALVARGELVDAQTLVGVLLARRAVGGP